MQALVELPGDISVTAVDVAAHEEVSGLAEGRGELTGLALWLMAERQKVRSQGHQRSILEASWNHGSTPRPLVLLAWRSKQPQLTAFASPSYPPEAGQM